MVDWGKGYITDIEYVDGFYPFMAPQHLALAAVFNGVEPPDIDGSFTYCELGCSRGLTSLVLAAVNPQATFHAVDFNPASIAHAQARARAAGLDNITFHELSFEALTEPSAGLPQCDVVAMHGVWTWVAPELHRAIVAFLQSHLKPGGLVYLSYNVLPAWNDVVPLQRVLRELVAAQPGRSDEAAGPAMALINRLAETKIIPPRFQNAIDRLNHAASRSEDLTYLAHEYLHSGWAPYYFADVARALGEAKLTYAGSTQLMNHFLESGLNAEQRALLSGIGTRELKETLRDFCTNLQFRQDIFVRGARPMTDVRRQSLLDAVVLAAAAPVPAMIEVPSPTGQKLRPDQPTYRRILDALQEGPRSVGYLRSLANPPIGTFELLAMLIDSGLARPWRGPRPDAEESAARFNATLADIPLSQGATIAVPALGIGLRLPPREFALYRALSDGETPDAALVAALLVASWREAGLQPAVDGKPIATEAETLAVVARECAATLARHLPLWRLLQIAPR